ncbi:hypothetical protein [Alloyangia pacifica]|uniref:Uncharacterized protein n=1 Tax=Alloyangia pacifica TaxID=311180 RepID=A0A1I6WMV6_9RHOB|nr:hypothetical protein [Alloyangia pacifica]SDI95857.1 hypothetical protein SAMN04488245_13414 [Alloyangia pacifica]SFT27327.1 hypothetical protein SAMN04488050_12914 [Alloyangia pacifica]
MIKTIATTLLGISLAIQVSAQTLSPDDIKRMLDEQAAAPNPYAALLNDPDPARSMGAMKIMMESGDPKLEEMAMEFGLLSSDAAVQRFVVERILDQTPNLFVSMDGTALDENKRAYLGHLAVTGMGGTIETNGMAYGRWTIGEYSQQEECWKWDRTCAFVSRPEGFFVTGRKANVSFDGRLEVTADGRLAGILRTDEGFVVPASITLLD